MTSDYEIKQAEAKLTRRIVITIGKTKNDISGKGPVAGRTFVLPCICMETLDTKEERQTWAKALKKEPFCSCINPCPFSTVSKYLLACPKAAAAGGEGLPFMRAVAARGDNRRLLTTKLGITQAKKSIELVRFTIIYHTALIKFAKLILLQKVNMRLPENLRLKKVSSRVGRTSFATLAMNNNASAEVTSLASKHKDPKTMLGYVRPDEGLLMQAALIVGT